MNHLNSWLTVVAAGMLRPLGMALLFPLLHIGSLGTPMIRNSLLLALTLPVLPMVYTLPDITAGTSWVSLIVQEMIIGLLLGFCAAIPFWAIDMAGFLIDTLRGSTMGTIFNPAMNVQTSLFGLLFMQIMCVLFLASGGFHQLLSLLYDSYHYLPLGKSLPLDIHWLDFLQYEWQVLYQLCLTFSLPTVICMILVDVSLGLINRSARQLNVFFLSMPIKSTVALLLLLLSCPFAFHHYLQQSNVMYVNLSQFLHRMAGDE